MATNTVSVEQAALTALTAWIKSQLPDLGSVNNTWPDEGVPFPPAGAVTILEAGAVQESIVVPPQVLKSIPDPSPAVTATYFFRTHFCEQPLQLDVWATSKYRRDDIINRLGDALTAGKAVTLSPAYFAAEGISTNQDPVVQSIVLQLAAPWDFLVAAYQFDAPSTEDSSESSGRREYRATYRGTGFFDRAVKRCKVPQLLNVRLQLTRSYLSPPPASAPSTTLNVTSTITSPAPPGSILVPPGPTTLSYANPWVLLNTTAGNVALALPAQGIDDKKLTVTVWLGPNSFAVTAPNNGQILDSETGELGNTFTPTPPAPGYTLVAASFTFAWSSAVSSWIGNAL